MRKRLSNQAGDTLIEVTMALAILGLVLVGATVIAMSSFRTGQAARERTAVTSYSQSQMEALRGFRDNHNWTEFRTGGGGYVGVDNVGATFHMEYVAALGEWVPKPGNVPAAQVPVPGTVINLKSIGSSAAKACGYDFELTSTFTPVGGGTPLKNVIRTRLVNTRYTGTASGCL